MASKKKAKRSEAQARRKTVRKSAPRKATAKKSPSKVLLGMALKAHRDKVTLGDVKRIKAVALKPNIKSTMVFPFRVNDGDLFRPLREEITAKLKKSGDAIELSGQPGQSYHKLYNRLSSVMVRPEFPKPPKGLKYVRRQGLQLETLFGTPDICTVILTLAWKDEKVPRGPRSRKTEAK